MAQQPMLDPVTPMMAVAVKRLSAVEVRKNRSNQHELNFTLARQRLGLTEEKLEGRITFVFLPEDGYEAESDEGAFTLYDSRRKQPKRSPEFRLYYYSDRLQEMGSEGDLLIVFAGSSPTELCALVIRTGTEAEQAALRALHIGDWDSIRSLAVIDVQPDDPGLVDTMVNHAPAAAVVAEYGGVASHPLYLQSVAAGRSQERAKWLLLLATLCCKPVARNWVQTSFSSSPSMPRPTFTWRLRRNWREGSSNHLKPSAALIVCVRCSAS
jgi:hypothetical protein